VEKDFELAREKIELAAEQGLPEALCELGAFYGKGLGVPVDRAKSIELYKQAAEAGHAISSCNLGVIFLNGDGVDQDIETGARYLSNAARLGSEEAKRLLLELKERHGIETPETPTVQ